MVLLTIDSWHSKSIRMAERTEGVNCNYNAARILKKGKTESLMQAGFEPSRKPLRPRTKGAVVKRYGCMSFPFRNLNLNCKLPGIFSVQPIS